MAHHRTIPLESCQKIVDAVLRGELISGGYFYTQSADPLLFEGTIGATAGITLDEPWRVMRALRASTARSTASRRTMHGQTLPFSRGKKKIENFF